MIALKRIVRTSTGIPANLQKAFVGEVAAVMVCIAFHAGSGRLKSPVTQAVSAIPLRSVNQKVSDLAVRTSVGFIATRVAEPKPNVCDMPLKAGMQVPPKLNLT